MAAGVEDWGAVAAHSRTRFLVIHRQALLACHPDHGRNRGLGQIAARRLHCPVDLAVVAVDTI